MFFLNRDLNIFVISIGKTINAAKMDNVIKYTRNIELNNMNGVEGDPKPSLSIDDSESVDGLSCTKKDISDDQYKQSKYNFIYDYRFVFFLSFFCPN